MSAELTIVIPVFNEREALPGLLDEIEAACTPLALSWEVLVVDDGSTDGTFELIDEGAGRVDWLRGVRLRRNSGKSTALAVGFSATSADYIVTIDGDGQDDPTNIPDLLKGLEDADLVSGWKRQRRDPWSRRAASQVFNRVTTFLSGVKLHDMNCGFKAYRGECARSLQIYGELHRYLPVLAHQQGWRVAEIPVNHRPREHGRSRFGGERYLRGALDLLTVSFLGRYQHRPLHLFGGIGLVLTFAGLVISLYMTILRLSGERIGDRPLLFLGVLLIVVGVQIGTFGLLGQMIVQVRRDRPAADQGLVAAVTGAAREPEGSSLEAAATDSQSSRTSDATGR